EIRAAAAVEQVVAVVAGKDVHQGVAGCVDVRRPGERQVLQVFRQGVGDRGQDGVRPAVARGLDDPVLRVVDAVDVVAGAAGQGVDASAAEQHVVAGAAPQGDAQASFRGIQDHAASGAQRLAADQVDTGQ